MPAVKKDKPGNGKLIHLEFRETKDLKPHPLNQQIYGETEPDPELVTSIKKEGIITPLVILRDGTIVSGHQRHAGAIKAESDKVPVTIFQSEDPLEIEYALIKANLQRQKTNEQKAREFSKLKEIETEKAKRRQIEAGRVNGRGQKVQENFPEAIGKGQARDLASDKLGVSGRTLDKSAKVVEVAEKLKASGEEEKGQDLLDTLNGKSVDRAYKTARKMETEGSTARTWPKDSLIIFPMVLNQHFTKIDYQPRPTRKFPNRIILATRTFSLLRWGICSVTGWNKNGLML